MIDNIFATKVVSYDESVYGILVTDISDHYPIFCVDKILKHKTIDLSFMRRDYSEKNKSSFLEWFGTDELAGCILYSQHTVRYFFIP